MEKEKETLAATTAAPAATAAVGNAAPQADEVELVDELIAEGRKLGDPMPSDMPPWMAKTITHIDRFSYRVGVVVSFLVVPIFLAMVYEIVARKFFIAPTIWAYDVSRMVYGAMFMLGSAYALMRGIHIRADFLYRTLSVRTQGMIDTTLYVLLFMPSMILFFYISLEFAVEAWQRGERIDETPWQPLAAPIRTAMPISAVLLIIQGISEILKSIYAMKHGKWA